MPKVTVYEKKGGASRQCEPCDARELVAGEKSLYTLTDPNAPAVDPAAAPAAPAILKGADSLPAEIDLGPKKVALGEVVAAANVASGHTVDAWNALTDKAREKLVVAHVEIMKAQALAASLDNAQRK